MNLMKLNIKEMLNGLQKSDFTAVELMEEHIKIVKNDDINAFVIKTLESAIEKAKEADKRIQSGRSLLLDGIPVGVKDLFCTKDVRSTACSHILDDFVPSYESTVSQKLFDHGAIMLGKNNMDEFAMGSANINSCYGNVINPWIRNDGKRVVPGGSSGGSAAAVAAYMCAAAIGSDTGGSVRQPASFCGIVGVKPTYGRCSRWGMIAFASSLDQAGVLARTVYDSALVLQSIIGHDPKDSTSAKNPNDNLLEDIEKDIKGMKVGIPKEYVAGGMSSEIKKLWEEGAAKLKSMGAEIIDISLPHTQYALPIYYIIAPAEASSNLARYDGVRYGLRKFDKGDSIDEMYIKTRTAGFGNEVKRRIIIGNYVLSSGYYDAYYNKAQKVRTLIAQDFNNAFEKVDMILTPTTPTPAFAFDEKLSTMDMYLNDIFTVPASLAGLPAISVPAGLSKTGLPLGLQLIGKKFDEKALFRFAQKLEESIGFVELKVPR